MSESVDGADATDYERSYRQRDVDERLDDVEHRVTRLEKAGLVALGYGIATGADIITALTSFV